MTTPRFLIMFTACLATSIACAPTADSVSSLEPQSAGPAEAAETTPSGGLLYDRWPAVAGAGASFVLGKSGGPNGNGTLNNKSGQALPFEGHDYRLKNLFGWDLRGAEGIYGPGYQAKSTVLSVNLLGDTRSVDELAAWFAEGDEQLPAFGQVLTPEELRATAEFIVAVRERRVPHPEQIWTLSDTAPKNYVLNPGADLEAGAAAVASKCVGCHGDNGTALIIDGTHSLGSFVRAKAYEAWIKVVSGQPGSAMGPQSTNATEILAILAALCDRTAFPALPDAHDVPDGDPRCGAYLK